MSSNYPLGAEQDPNAPWKEEDQEDKEIEVTVSVTLSKTFKVSVNDYKVIDSGVDEDGLYYEDIDYSECNLKQAVEDQIFLPYEASDYIDSQVVKEDLKGWNIDDFEVELG